MDRENGTELERFVVNHNVLGNATTAGLGVRGDTEDVTKGVANVPDPEVSAKATRRRFSAAYKARILQETDACTPGSGELGALLRREG